ncbi:Retrotransposon gag protein [Rhizoctonia solani]|uniref:Retrotransposon gag protein n=1 Tax=Rhizoctonia solani TaxID=456999 RepID=A0A8H7MA66_9AGAM|nr:Retrotransposon gag protein [Rhizoctonia solani]
MEPEPSPSALLKAITALTATVGSLQDQIQAQSQQIIELRAICKETADLLGIKIKEQPKPSLAHRLGLSLLPPTWEEKPTLQARLGLGSRPHSGLQEGPGLTQRKRKNQGGPKKSLRERLQDTWDPSPPSTQGPADQFDEEEQMVVWILYHMTDKAADWALPIIGMIIKGEGNPPNTIQALTAKFKEAFADPDAKRAAARKIATLTQTTTTSEYVTEFRNLMAELDWNTEAYIAQFMRGLHWKVKELLSTKDNIPDDDLKAIFAASVKIDNTSGKRGEPA